MADADLVERAKAELLRRRAMKELQRRQELKAQQPATPTKEGFDYGVLPLHADADGSLSFSSDAGILGGLKRSVMLGGDVMSGDVPLTDADGRTSEELIGRSLEAATTFTPAALPLRTGEKLIPGAAKNIVQEVPDSSFIKQTASDGYDAARDLGVALSPDAVKDMALAGNQKLFEKGFLDNNAKSVRSLLDELANPPVAGADETVTVPLANLEVARRNFNNTAANKLGGPESAAARAARDHIDAFIRNPPEGSVVSGDSLAATRLYREADKNYAAAKKSETIADILKKSKRQSGSSNSGLNEGNNIRQKIAALLGKPKESGRFTSAEREALDSISNGTTKENAVRNASNMLAGGGGVGAGFMGAGTATLAALASGQPSMAMLGAVPIATGYGLRKVANALTRNRLKAVDEEIRASAPVSKDSPTHAVRDSKREAILRALMMQKVAPQVPDDAFWDSYLAGEAT